MREFKNKGKAQLSNHKSGRGRLREFLTTTFNSQLKEVSQRWSQRAKKVVSDSPGLVDFAIGLVKSVFNLPDGQVMFFEEFE